MWYRAIEVWGSWQVLESELVKRQREREEVESRRQGIQLSVCLCVGGGGVGVLALREWEQIYIVTVYLCCDYY